MDGDGELPNIDLNPSGSDTISSGGDEDSSYNGDDEPLPGDHGQVQSSDDQTPEDGDFPNAASANSEPTSTNLNNSQGEEGGGSNIQDDESTLPSGYQGKDTPSMKPYERPLISIKRRDFHDHYRPS